MNPPQTELERRFGAKVAEEWSYLIDFLELHTGFSTNIILVPDATAARICAAELEKFLATKNKRLEKIEFSTPEALQANFAPWLLEGANLENAGALWLASVSTAFDPKHEKWRKAWAFAAARVNERRDELIRRCTLPIFIVAATWTNETLRQAAPDWWSVRSLVVTLKPEISPSEIRPEERFLALETGRRILQEDPSGDQLLDPDISFETAARLRGVQGEEKGLIRMLDRAFSGLIYRERYAEAEAVAREMLSIEENINAPILEKAGSWGNIGYTFLMQGRLEEAEKAFRTALEWQESGGASLKHRGITMDLLGRVFHDSGRLEEAEKAFRTALEWQESGDNSLAGRSIIMHNLGQVLFDSGRLEEAEKAFRTAHEWQESGDNSLAGRSIIMHNLGRVLLDSGRLEEAEKAFRTVLEWKESGGDSLINRSITMHELGRVLGYAGRLEEAEKAFLQSIEMSTEGGATSDSIQITRDALEAVQRQLNRTKT